LMLILVSAVLPGPVLEKVAVLALFAVVVGMVIFLLWFLNRGWAGAFGAAQRAYDSGRYADAEKHLQRALDAAESFAADDANRIATQDLLGRVYLIQGKFD